MNQKYYKGDRKISKHLNYVSLSGNAKQAKKVFKSFERTIEENICDKFVYENFIYLPWRHSLVRYCTSVTIAKKYKRTYTRQPLQNYECMKYGCHRTIEIMKNITQRIVKTYAIKID